MIREEGIYRCGNDVLQHLYLVEFTEIMEDAERLLDSIESKIY